VEPLRDIKQEQAPDPDVQYIPSPRPDPVSPVPAETDSYKAVAPEVERLHSSSVNRGGGSSRWSAARIEMASNACVEVLRQGAGAWMPRQEVRGLARDKVGRCRLKRLETRVESVRCFQRFETVR